MGWFFLLFDWGVRGKGGKLLLNFHQMLAMRHGTVEGEAQSFSLKLNFLEAFLLLFGFFNFFFLRNGPTLCHLQMWNPIDFLRSYNCN